ncbi:ferritin-like domain-containing protein [Robertmurraya massiliosenegalensis]|uniref:ferritin-like domain-containing protein n=1 Tax=Robertmurraya TaxID=2837507 RepID=UPI0039A74B89
MNNHYLTYFPRDNNLVSDIAKAIDGEYSAIACYKKLANIAPTQKAKNVITEIRKDEKMHFNVFSNIYTQLTGQKHTPKITEQCPNEYLAGIDFAFNDEQETVDFYLDIAKLTTDPYIKEQFTRAASDEQNHAVWFLYFLR